MIKIVATLSDFGAYIHTGADVERTSVILSVPTKNIPEILKNYLTNDGGCKKHGTLSFSLLDEEI